MALGSGALTTGGDNSSMTFSGVISGAGAVNKTGTGTMTLSGANPVGADKIDATGTVDVTNSNLDLSLLGSYVHTPGTTYTIIANDGTDPVSGTFSGLPEGATIDVGGKLFTISYAGGTNDNDVVLTAGASPTLATNASADITAGDSVHDTATLAGGLTPGGQITFKLYGPNDSDCSGTPAFTSTETVSGNGDYVSADFTRSRPAPTASPPPTPATETTSTPGATRSTSPARSPARRFGRGATSFAPARSPRPGGAFSG